MTNRYQHEFFELIKLAVPLVFAQLAQNTLSFVDTLMVGRLGNEAIAGIAIGSTVFFFVYMVLMGVILGVGPIVSQAFGADDPETVGRATRQGFWLGLILFVPAFALYWNAYPILILLDQPPETAAQSAAYLRAISWGLLPALWSVNLRGLLEGVGDTRPIMAISFVAVLLNIFFNNVLMFGWYGVPALGLVGTGYASTIVFSLAFLLMGIYVHIRYSDFHVFQKIRIPDPAMLKQVFLVGGPISLTLGFEGSMFSAAAILMGRLGEEPLAAHQIALQTASISFMVPLGVAIATGVRVGHAVGRGSRGHAETAGYVGLLVCAGVMSISAVAFWLFPQWIVSWYIDVGDSINRRVVDYATGFLAIAAVFQVFDGLQVAGSGALRGLKDTTAAMLLTMVSYWCVGAVAGGLLYVFGDLEGRGLWIGMTAGLATAAILLSSRFRWKVRQFEFEA